MKLSGETPFQQFARWQQSYLRDVRRYDMCGMVFFHLLLFFSRGGGGAACVMYFIFHMYTYPLFTSITSTTQFVSQKCSIGVRLSKSGIRIFQWGFANHFSYFYWSSVPHSNMTNRPNDICIFTLLW